MLAVVLYCVCAVLWLLWKSAMLQYRLCCGDRLRTGSGSQKDLKILERQVEKHWKSFKANMDSLLLRLGAHFKWLFWSCVANMDFSKSIYRKGFFFWLIFPIVSTLQQSGEQFAHTCSCQEKLPQINKWIIQSPWWQLIGWNCNDTAS